MHHRSIEQLPLSVVEKIAAGEVIERPASVLKELVENAIDADADRIDITLENAGFSLIKVSDNGCGMSLSDINKCLLRHATSKIKTADDLFAIATMGFRGEALASIAAVSRMTVTTSPDITGLGQKLVSEGGIRGAALPASHSQGTSIEVKDLFFNVPARKKFMKSARSENLAAIRVIEQLAIPFPGIQFTMVCDGKKLLDFPIVDSVLSRIASVAGHEFARDLIECTNSREGMEVTVYVSSPEKKYERPRFQNLYVNLRRIDNDSVLYGIREGFSKFLGAHFRPAFFCFLAIDPSRIDVNVHPTKQQVKFDDERLIFSLLHGAVHRGLGDKAVVPEALMKPDSGNYSSLESPPDATQENIWDRLRDRANTLPTSPPTVSEEPLENEFPPLPRGNFFAAGSFEAFNHIPDTIKINEKQIDAGSEDTVQLTTVQINSDSHAPEWDLISCYQIHEMYILAPIKNGILLIDQHAAHERVLYEQALEDLKRGRATSQQLLFPVIVELSVMEKAIVESGRDYFRAFGFETDDFGGNAISISAIPFFVRSSQVQETIQEMVRYLLDEKERDVLLEPEKRFAAAFACGSAIKTGQQLTQEEMNALLNSLFATKNPYTCPHGRPTHVRISLDELARRFLR